MSWIVYFQVLDDGNILKDIQIQKTEVNCIIWFIWTKRNETWGFWTFGYFHNWLFLTGFLLVVSNMKYFLYVIIFIGIFILFIVLLCSEL